MRRGIERVPLRIRLRLHTTGFEIPGGLSDPCAFMCMMEIPAWLTRPVEFVEERAQAAWPESMGDQLDIDFGVEPREPRLGLGIPFVIDIERRAA